jgi:FkbM family methyltransferase
MTNDTQASFRVAPRSRLKLASTLSNVKRSVKRGVKAVLHDDRWNSDDDQQALAGRAQTIFDVGGNVGQSIKTYRQLYPQARIWSFEPVPEAMAQLRNDFGSDPLVYPHQIALSDGEGTVPMHLQCGTVVSSLLKPTWVATRETIEVPTTTLDEFCSTNGIDSIDILKVDVEGSEMKVFHGAREMFKRRAIRLVFTEVYFRQLFDGMPLMWDQHAELLGHGFRLHRLYSLTAGRDGSLDYANALYVR